MRLKEPAAIVPAFLLIAKLPQLPLRGSDFYLTIFLSVVFTLVRQGKEIKDQLILISKYKYIQKALRPNNEMVRRKWNLSESVDQLPGYLSKFRCSFEG
jgi:hypothetical protein